MRAGFIGRESIVLLAQSGVPVALTGTTLETAMASVVVPGGLMGPHGSLRITYRFSTPNNANNKTMRVRFGGIAGASLGSRSQSLSACSGQIVLISNRGIENSQVGVPVDFPWGGNTGNAIATGAVDTSADQVAIITGQLSSGADTMTLEGWTFEVLRG